jgi:hypothetical protein
VAGVIESAKLCSLDEALKRNKLPNSTPWMARDLYAPEAPVDPADQNQSVDL